MAPGRIDGPVYFVRRDGKILLAPASDTQTPPGCDRRKVETLDELDHLQRILEQETRSQCQQEIERDQKVWYERRKEIRDRLLSRMNSSATSAYEREFIQLYLQISDDRKRDLYKQRFMCDQAYFMAREFDDGGAKKIAQSHDVTLEEVMRRG
jgi:hypothetical protein